MERKGPVMKSMKVNNNIKLVNTNKTVINFEKIQEMAKWPPRSYNCSFCKREFRSAQALGGHMNVHRKERARQIRLSPPHHHHFDINAPPLEDSWIRPRSPSSSPSKKFSSFGTSSALTTVKSPPSWGEMKKLTTNFMKKDDAKVCNLELKIGNLVKQHNLDLELRLGFSKN